MSKSLNAIILAIKHEMFRHAGLDSGASRELLDIGLRRDDGRLRYLTPGMS